MARLVVIENVSLDGVMQAPGRPDEDTRGGFTAGGWGVPYSDHVAVEHASGGSTATSAFLLGRRTYLDFHGFWPHQGDNPFTKVLDETPKYVVSRTLRELAWQNSTLLTSLDDVAALKHSLDGDIVVLGSGQLAGSLGALVDRYVLSFHPIVLGSGRKISLARGAFRLTEYVVTTTGVIIASYVRTTS